MRKIIILCCCLLMLSSRAYAGEVRDDFEDGNANGWNEVAGGWEVQDGAYVQLGMDLDGVDGIPRTIIQSPWDFGNGTIEANIAFDRQAAGTEIACILYRMIDDDNGYIFCLSSTHLTVGKLVEGVFESIRGDAYPVNTDKTINIKLVIDGVFTKVYYDGTLTNRIGDPNGKGDEKGKVGLAVRDANQPVYFEDIVISGDSVSPFLEFGGKAVETAGKLASAWGRIKTR